MLKSIVLISLMMIISASNGQINSTNSSINTTSLQDARMEKQAVANDSAHLNGSIPIVHVVPVFDFKCESESFIHLARHEVCDGQNQCPDGSDETVETCLRIAGQCPPGLHKCRNETRCLNHSQLCDGNKDCSSGWDETPYAGCSTKHMLKNENQTTCFAGYSSCDSPFNRCIPDNAKCDYRKDCDGGEDETDCKDGRKCPDGMYHCYRTGAESDDIFHHHCINQDHICDQITDCPNGEDESESACAYKSNQHNSGGHGGHHKDKGMENQSHHVKSASSGTDTVRYGVISTIFLIAGLRFI